jgi:hypothetical protein
MKADLRTVLHGLSQNMRTQFARQTGRNSLVKEKPNVAAIAGSRAFQGGEHFEPPAGFEKGRRILPPVFAVEVHRQKKQVSSCNMA